MNFHGNLPQDRFGDLETTLARTDRLMPISDGSHFGEGDLSKIARYAEWTEVCLGELLRRYPIPADVFHVRLFADFPNAFVSGLHNGGYIICFNEALFPALLYASHHVLMTPAVQALLGIDQANLPVAEKGSLQEAFVLPGPTSMDIHEAADLMTFIAHRFIVHHEFQHLKAGHLDWLRQGAKSDLLMEAVGQRPGVNDDFRRTLHTLEMDADAFALVNCLYDTARMLEGSNPQSKALVDYLTRYDEALVKLVVLSVFMFFRVTDNGLLQRFDNPFVRSHPNGANRGALLSISGGEYLRSAERPAMRQIDWPHLCSDVLWCCEHGLSYLAGVEPKVDRLKPTPGYLDLLLSRWAKIRPALDRAKLAGQLVEANRAPG